MVLIAAPQSSAMVLAAMGGWGEEQVSHCVWQQGRQGKDMTLKAPVAANGITVFLIYVLVYQLQKWNKRMST